MPQTPSFFIPNGLSLYNPLVGQRLSLRSEAAAATQPVGRTTDMNHPTEIVLTLANVSEWPEFQKLLNEGKIVADSNGRLRYPHGAPVGTMILTGTAKDGTTRSKESAAEWFDPDSKKANEFVWPA